MANSLYEKMGTSIFATMSALATEYDAINLGQGFPDGTGPHDVINEAARALHEDSNQYAPMQGTPALRQAIAAHYREHQGISLDWREEVTVTSGATEALAAAFFALIEPGDEVVLFQPMYDSYAPVIRRAGGIPRFVSLSPPEWRIDAAALAAAFSPRTRLVVFNNPLNPAASVANAEEMQFLADFIIRHNAIAISDEVWEHIVFDGRRHEALMAIPGMRERTVKIGSAGKIFSMTGWKLGWLCAAPALTRLIARAHQFLTFSTPPNLQAAVACGLAKDSTYFEEMRGRLERSRNRLAAGLHAVGYVTLPSAGTYFMSIDLPASGIAMTDGAFCTQAVRAARVAMIPNSAFYEEAPVQTTVRLCFAKIDTTLDMAIDRLAAFRTLSFASNTPGGAG